MESAVVEQKKLDDELNKHCGLYVQVNFFLKTILTFFLNTTSFFIPFGAQGVFLAYSIRHVLTTVMNLHVTCNKAMNKTSVLALCRLMELLQVILLISKASSIFLCIF